MSDVLKALLKNLDKGFYHEAAAQPVKRSCMGYLSDQLAGKGLAPSQEEIDRSVAKLLGHAGISKDSMHLLSAGQLESVERFAQESWALGMALACEGIRVKGATSDTLDKFFATTTSTVLFPTYVESQVMLGILAASLLPSLVATETFINSHTYQSLAFTDVEADQQMKKMGEGATIPSTTITTADRAITLGKYGRMLEATYESLRLQRVNVVSIMLQRIGTRIALDESNAAIEVLIAGDGNTGSPVVDTDAEVSGTLDYDELVRLFLAFPEGYQMTTAVANSTNLRTILNMAEFKDPQAGFNFQRTGVLPGPMGAEWKRWDSTNSTSFSTDRILAVDNRYALEQVTEQGVTTESDKLIDRQFERTAITKWTGFAKLDYNATQCLDITT